MIVFTSVKPEFLERLEKNLEATAEFHSYHNVLAGKSVRPGDMVFLTDEFEEHVRRGVNGVVARVEHVNIGYFRTGDKHTDEREMLRVRMKLSFVGVGRIREVVRNSVIMADIDLYGTAIIG